MKLFSFGKDKKSQDIFPVSGILLNLPAGVPNSRMFRDTGIWRKTACFGSLNATIRGNPLLFADLPPISFMWSAKRPPAKGHTVIYCEQGWLPRSGYQISSLGVNQLHHVTIELRDKSITIPAATSLELEHLDHLKLGFPPAIHPSDLCEEPFFLFALQLSTDLNLRQCGLDLANASGRKDGSEFLLQQLSSMIADCHSGARVLFLQHPAEKVTVEVRPLLQANHEYVPNTRKLRFLDLATSPACLGVMSINSNALNEAMLFSRPVFQIGDFLMKRFPNHLYPNSLEEFLQEPDQCLNSDISTRYLAHLMRHQTTLEDLIDPVALRKLIIKEMARIPIRE